jgi:hypothetical protein
MLEATTEMTTVTIQAVIITVETITTPDLVSIEVGVQAMIDTEVIAVTGTMIERASMVVPLALIERLFLIAEIAIMIVVTETYNETIVQIGREITTVEEMTMIGLPPLGRNPYWVRKTRCPRSKSAFDCRGYSKAELKFDNKHHKILF